MLVSSLWLQLAMRLPGLHLSTGEGVERERGKEGERNSQQQHAKQATQQGALSGSEATRGAAHCRQAAARVDRSQALQCSLQGRHTATNLLTKRPVTGAALAVCCAAAGCSAVAPSCRPKRENTRGTHPRTCAIMSMPPTSTAVLSPMPAPSASNCSAICMASSRVGDSTSAYNSCGLSMRPCERV